MSDDKPLVLVDVDGVLNPFVKQGKEWLRHQAMCGGTTYNVLLNAEHGAKLLALAEETGAELVWATTWEHDANTAIGPLVGLPKLPVIEVLKGDEAPFGVCFKSPAVANYVNGRPFVWFDDDLGRADRLWFNDHPNVGEFRLIHIGSKRGITDKHIQQARAWLLELAV